MPTLPSFIREALSDVRSNAFVGRVDGVWTELSSTGARERIDDLAVALREVRQLAAGGRVAIVAANSVDWLIADFAILSAGLVVVPIFPTQALDQIAFIFANSETKLVFADTPACAERLRALPNCPPVIVFAGEAESIAELEAQGAVIRAGGVDAGRYADALDEHQMAILMYTSGTTGTPKGVMLSHMNLISNAIDLFDYGFRAVPAGAPVLSVLPFSHIYEHMVAYGYLRARVAIYVCGSPDHLVADLRGIRPFVLTAVPRIFERMLSAIVVKAKHEGGLKARIVPWALAVGRDYMRAAECGLGRLTLALRVQYALAHTLLLKKLRPLLGLDRLVFFGSGSAALHIDIAMTLLAADVIILEGYGPTECSPAISVNRLGENRYGTVGKPIPHVEVRLADDGEILARGPGVMLGYYRDPVATAAVMRDGFYCTGDIGTIDADGYLRITDRKRELFKTSQGKFIAPARIETALKRSVYINQAVVVGSGQAHPVALIAPFWDLVRKELGLGTATPAEELIPLAEVHKFLRREVAENTADLGKFERIRHFVVLPRDLSIEDGELSPTLKVKRRVVEERYASLIQTLYADPLRIHAR